MIRRDRGSNRNRLGSRPGARRSPAVGRARVRRPRPPAVEGRRERPEKPAAKTALAISDGVPWPSAMAVGHGGHCAASRQRMADQGVGACCHAARASAMRTNFPGAVRACPESTFGPHGVDMRPWRLCSPIAKVGPTGAESFYFEALEQGRCVAIRPP